MKNFLIIVLLILAVICIHEIGHLYACLYFGIKVNSFSVGFGPTLLSHVARDIEFKLGIIPFGGYVAIDIEQLQQAPLLQQVVIYVSGMFLGVTIAFLTALVYLEKINIPEKYQRLVTNAPLPIRRACVLFIGTFGIWVLSPILVIKHIKDIAGPIKLFRELPKRLAGGDLRNNIASLFVLVNVGISGINLFPMAPLDGGKIVDAIIRVNDPLFAEFYSTTTIITFVFLFFVLILKELFQEIKRQ